MLRSAVKRFPESWAPVAGFVGLIVVGLLFGLGISALTRGTNGAQPAPPALLADTPTGPVIISSGGPAVAVQVTGAPAPAPVHATPVAPRATHHRETKVEQNFTAVGNIAVADNWVAQYYPIYAAASKAFNVNWLLIASIHRQETAFSTAPGIYHGLNFARCCAGPMQFNVTNKTFGGLSTWGRYKNAYTAAPRPATYNHVTVKHPSVYDDFDAIMAAAALLHDDGAGPKLDASAWSAAYSYYGHDLTGVDYADQVLARSISWGLDKFCPNCDANTDLLGRVEAAWGAPVRASYDPPKALIASVKKK